MNARRIITGFVGVDLLAASTACADTEPLTSSPQPSEIDTGAASITIAATSSTSLPAVHPTSVSGSGTAMFVAPASNAVVAGDGCCVAYLRPTETGGTDIEVYDRSTGVSSPLLPAHDAATGFSGSVWSLAMSDDGRVVGFAPDASDLVADDTNGLADVFVHDRERGLTERVSVTSSGRQSLGDPDSGRHPASGHVRRRQRCRVHFTRR